MGCYGNTRANSHFSAAFGHIHESILTHIPTRIGLEFIQSNQCTIKCCQSFNTITGGIIDSLVYRSFFAHLGFRDVVFLRNNLLCSAVKVGLHTPERIVHGFSGSSRVFPQCFFCLCYPAFIKFSYNDFHSRIPPSSSRSIPMSETDASMR